MQVRKPRNTWFLISGASFFTTLAWFMNAFPPTKPLHLFVFFLTLFLSCFSLFLYVLNNTRRSLLLSSGVTVFLVLRLLDLRSPLYLVLLLASLISLELSLRKR